jgi:putative tricarboxylic transport membrane protein
MLAFLQRDKTNREGTVRRGRLIACVCLLAIFVAALVTSLDYSLTDALGPGPGFFPFWLSLIGAGLTLAILVQDVRSPDTSGEPLLPDRPAMLRGAGVLIALALVAALLEPLGFRLTMLVFIAGLLFWLGARSPTAIALTAAAGSFGVFHVFYYWLKVPLPIGALGL